MPEEIKRGQKRPSLYSRPVEWSIVLCQVILVLLVLLVSISVFCRAIGFPIEMTEEIAGYLLVAFTFLSLAGCAVHGAYHRVELLTARLGKKAFLVLETIFVFVCLLATLLLDWYFVLFVIQTYQSGNVAATQLATPLWIPQIMMPLGTFLLTYALAFILKRDLLVLYHGTYETLTP